LGLGPEQKICQDCIPLAQQTATNLQRSATFASLENRPEEPLTRSERTALIAAKLAAEGEADELKLRGEQLYRANVDLTQQVQTHTLRAREHATQIQTREAQIEKLQERLEQREHQLADASAELQRLQVLVPFVGKETTPEDRGLPSSSTVDG